MFSLLIPFLVTRKNNVNINDKKMLIQVMTVNRIKLVIYFEINCS